MRREERPEAMDEDLERYFAAFAERTRRPARTYSDVLWQVEFETHAGLDSDEFTRRVDERAKALGITIPGAAIGDCEGR